MTTSPNAREEECKTIIRVVGWLCEEIRVNELINPAEGIEDIVVACRARYDAGMTLIAKYKAEIAQEEPPTVLCLSICPGEANGFEPACTLPKGHTSHHQSGPLCWNNDAASKPSDAQPATCEAWRVIIDNGVVHAKLAGQWWVRYQHCKTSGSSKWSKCEVKNNWEQLKGLTELTGPAAEPYIASLKRQLGEVGK